MVDWVPNPINGFVRLSITGTELLFEVFSQRYECGSTMVMTNLPIDEWTIFGSECLTGGLLDRLTHHVHILELNSESYRPKKRKNADQQNPTINNSEKSTPDDGLNCGKGALGLVGWPARLPTVQRACRRCFTGTI